MPKMVPPKNLLKSARDKYQKGNPIGLVEAIPFCIVEREDIPKWVVDASIVALKHFCLTYKVKGAASGQAFKQQKSDFADYRSYLAVRQAMKHGHKGDAKFDEARRLLASNWNINRAVSTIRSAHDHVQAQLKTDKGMLQYAAFRGPAAPFLMRVLSS